MISLFNIIWFLFIGWWSSLVYLVLAIFLGLTIIGIPIAKSLLQFAKLNAFPYGKVVIRESKLKGKNNVSSIRKIGGLLLNIIWFPIGIILTIYHLLAGILAFISIIGIPVGIVYIRMGKFLLSPIGTKVVKKEVSDAAELKNYIDQNS